MDLGLPRHGELVIGHQLGEQVKAVTIGQAQVKQAKQRLSRRCRTGLGAD